MTTAEQATRQVENIIREMLTERFNDTFVFNPIIVIPRVDHDGDYYLHAYVPGSLPSWPVIRQDH